MVWPNKSLAGLSHKSDLCWIGHSNRRGGTDMTTDVVPLISRRNDRAFYAGASLLIIVVVFVGFAPTYFLNPTSEK